LPEPGQTSSSARGETELMKVEHLLNNTSDAEVLVATPIKANIMALARNSIERFGSLILQFTR